MKGRKPFSFESLESRYCLTVAAAVDNGDLVITGDADGPVAIVAVPSDSGSTYSVTDNGVTVASGLVVTDDVRINLDASAGANNAVSLDLAGQTLDEIAVRLGNGNNIFTLEGGTLTGSLKFTGGSGADTLVVAADAAIEGSVSAHLGAGDNTVTIDGDVSGGVSIKGGDDGDIVAIGVDAIITRGLYLHLGHGLNEVHIAGDVNSLSVHAGGGDDLVELLATAAVANSVSLDLGNGNNEASVAGDVAGNVAIRAGSGNDSLSISADTVIDGTVSVKLGGGTNTFSHAGEIAGDLRVTSATADDVFTVAEAAVVGGEQDLTPGEESIGGSGHCGPANRSSGAIGRAVAFARPFVRAFARR